MSYVTFGNFGPSKPNDPGANPLAICAVSGLDAGFNNNVGLSSVLNPGNSQCQAFMGMYCGQNWDGVCEYLSNDNSRKYPNTQQNCNGPSTACFGSGIGSFLTSGQILIRNAAAEKYLEAMSGNCEAQYQPFDPTTADSPLIRSWVVTGGGCQGSGCDGRNMCIPMYSKVNPKTIDNDPLMNKVLDQPWIAMDILTNMYNALKGKGKLQSFAGTRLYKFFNSKDFQSVFQSGAIQY